MSRYFNPGDNIRLGNYDFTIKGIEGKGASCVVYRAARIIEGIVTEHLLKEYHPTRMEIDRLADGTLEVSEDDQVAFTEGLERFKAGYKLQAEIRQISELKNPTANIQDIIIANNTCYVDMSVYLGSDYGALEEEKSLHGLLLRMREVTRVIGLYHKAGYLHLDIKPENIYIFSEHENVISLFDFDSVTKEDEITQVRGLSYSKSWAAPEQISPLKQKNICKATDLYAIGEMIFWRIFGRHSQPEERRSFFEYSFDMEAPLFQNVNPRVRPLLAEVLHKTLCADIKGRYQSAEELLAQLDKLIKLADPKEPYLVCASVTPKAFFVGREHELEEIHNNLQKNDILFLSGIGGIGKSELAKNYAKTHMDNGDYDTILFATYNGSWLILINDDNSIHIANFECAQEEKELDYYRRKIKLLKELCKEQHVLLVVDNMNDDKFEDEAQAQWEQILNLGCKLLITTRVNNFEPCIKVEAFSEIEDLRKLFYKHSQITEASEIVDKIIDYVGRHTLTVELVAKQIEASAMSPEEMLEAMRKHGITKGAEEDVLNDKDNKRSYKTAEEHIAALFDIAKLSEAEKYVLANMSLIPPSGISKKLFKEWCELKTFNDINRLVARGWLDKIPSDVIKLHPVICDVIKTIQFDDGFFDVLYRNGMDCICGKAFQRMCPAEKGTIISILVNMADVAVFCDIRTEVVAKFLSSDFWVDRALSYVQNSYACAEKFLKHSIEVWESLGGNRTLELVESYGNLGMLFAYSNKLGVAFDYTQKAIQMIKTIPDYDVLQLATLYDNLGYMYTEQNDYAKAEECYLNAISICRNCNVIPSTQIALVYNNLGSLYQDWDRYEDSEKNFNAGLQILLETYGSLHPDTALIYNNLGVLYTEIAEFQKAEEMYCSALKIRKELLGEENADTADSYHGIGFICLKAHKYDQAEESLKKALHIRERIYGTQSGKVANSYNVLGGLYDMQGKCVEAEKCWLIALAIRKSLCGENSSEVALSCNNLGALYTDMRRFAEAEKYLYRALTIRTKIFGCDHTETAGSYYRVGLFYKSTGNIEQAQYYIGKGYAIYQNTFGDCHPKTIDMKTTLDSIKN